MTTLEHAMVGVDLVLAMGATRRYGWQLAAIAGIAATLPDWDGLPVLWSSRQFDRVHRAWGHGLLSCFLLAVVLAWIDSRYDLVTHLTRVGVRVLHVQIPETWQNQLQIRKIFNPKIGGVWFLTILMAAVSHPLCDALVSGGRGLPDWPIQIFWPFSTYGLVWPVFHWGDVGVTLILVGYLFAMLRWRSKTKPLALAAFLSIAGYAFLRYGMF